MESTMISVYVSELGLQCQYIAELLVMEGDAILKYAFIILLTM